LSFLLLDGDAPRGVFTGGSLLVGAAARTDLVDPERTEELARAQYRSLQRLLTLPDDVAVWPTHGAGWFCSAPPGAQRTSTIGREKATNPLLRAPDEDAFVAALLGSLGSFPPYFLHLAEANRRGPALLDHPPVLAPIDPARVRALFGQGAELVDVRPIRQFAAAHIPGSLNIELREVFATWLGWLAPRDRPLIVLRDPRQDPEEVAWQAAKIGYDDNLVGELAGGLDAWTAAGHPTTAIRLTEPGSVGGGGAVLDVRQDSEYAAGHLPHAQRVELGALPERASELPRKPYVVMCGHGERAMTAASLLERAGHHDLTVLIGSGEQWAAGHGTVLETGR
jgi:rhodanese-related sulfurtransferase